MNCAFCKTPIKAEGSSALAFLTDSEGCKHTMCQRCATKILTKKVVADKQTDVDLADENEDQDFSNVKVKPEPVFSSKRLRDEYDEETDDEANATNQRDISSNKQSKHNDRGNDDSLTSDDNIDHEPTRNNEDKPNTEMSQEEIDAAKKEKARKKKEEERKYGERALLARQIAVQTNNGQKIWYGMMKLGGGNCSPDMWWHNTKEGVKNVSDNMFYRCLCYLVCFDSHVPYSNGS
jgi:hypothetical protein